ncbi:antitoxin VbhA family protein [Burkholderia glumae]|uniref:antitoxin VbhA family protein n=1 Tax=Burkholderia glumae TaxID=337 RepID=UPI002036A2CE|nr:antitoxin VbhA family protein [Burkholderia glumae]MCM2491106.1 antitoxin VbhA family protein [Burkholderia glumae]
MITIEERVRRADAVRRGFANVELEGFVIPRETKELAARFVAGEISLGEFLTGEVGGRDEQRAADGAYIGDTANLSGADDRVGVVGG